MPEPKHSVMAVIVSGGKQYRVVAGDQILVGRLKAEVGDELRLDRVLLHDDGSTLHIGNPNVADVAVMAKVLRHSRGPRLEMLRYKSKKRVRVHKGARADYTAVEILAIGDHRAPVKSAAATRPASAKSVGKTAEKRSPETSSKTPSVKTATKRAPRSRASAATAESTEESS